MKPGLETAEAPVFASTLRSGRKDGWVLQPNQLCQNLGLIYGILWEVLISFPLEERKNYTDFNGLRMDLIGSFLNYDL